MSRSKISIALCTFNGADYLAAQLDSLVSQTRTPDELVICDDSSVDATQVLLKDFAAQAPMPVMLHFNKQNLGAKKNFELAIGLCSGEIVVLCDQDDVWQPEKLRRLEDTFSHSPEAGLVFSDAEIVDSDLRSWGMSIWQVLGFDRRERKSIERGKFDLLAPGWTVSGATMAFRAKYRELCLPIPTELPMLHDGWIALTIASVAEVIPLNEQLIKYRCHPNQHIGVPSPQQVDLHGLRESIRIALRRPSSYSELPRILVALQERLSANQEGFDCRNALNHVQDYLRHLETRASLRPKKLARIPAILRELTSLRYHHFSNGFQSAAKDLLSLSVRSPKS